MKMAIVFLEWIGGKIETGNHGKHTTKYWGFRENWNRKTQYLVVFLPWLPVLIFPYTNPLILGISIFFSPWNVSVSSKNMELQILGPFWDPDLGGRKCHRAQRFAAAWQGGKVPGGQLVRQHSDLLHQLAVFFHVDPICSGELSWIMLPILTGSIFRNHPQ